MPASRMQGWSRSLVVTAILMSLLLTSDTAVANTQKQQSDASAIAWAMKAMSALTGGVPVNGATLSGTVVQGDDPDQNSVPVTLQATGVSASEVDITTSKGVRSVIRSLDSSGRPSGTWIDINQQQHPIALHSCWTDAVWFFPALSELSSYTDPSLVFLDLGQEQHLGATVEHIRVYRNLPGDQNKAALVAKLSTVNYYLDINTAVPIAMSFMDHPNEDLLTNLPVRIEFSNCRLVGLRLVPYQITRYTHENPQSQITVSNANLN
jgi:hypothetical protein